MEYLEIFTKTKRIVEDEKGECVETEYSVHPVVPVVIAMVVLVLVLFFV